jgi:serine/threonine protein kinase
MARRKKTDIPKNLYDVLEVSPRARDSVIKASFKALMKEYHPDVCEDDRIAKSLTGAHRVLTNKKQRTKYDQERSDLEGKIIGGYRVLELIAEGGFGKTYKGEQVILNAPVCIKHGHNVSPQDEEILLEEAKSVWDLRHYSIPTMRDLLKLDDGSLALVMSYVPGPTLEKIVDKVGKVEPEHVCWITERVINALMYLHFNGVVHGDIKPQNIIIQPESHTVVLVDYGLSAIRPDNASSNKGYTPYFASPEQKRGSTILPESDFYSLGMTMIYALGGDVRTKEVPDYTPDPVCDFIRGMIVHDVLSRPNWEKGNLFEDIQKVRHKTFGRKRSNMKPIPGL